MEGDGEGEFCGPRRRLLTAEPVAFSIALAPSELVSLSA